jgi:hypothetical protein
MVFVLLLSQYPKKKATSNVAFCLDDDWELLFTGRCAALLPPAPEASWPEYLLAWLLAQFGLESQPTLVAVEPPDSE